MLARIDDAAARWAANRPPSYSITVSMYDRNFALGRCGEGAVRATVDDGVLVQARDLRFHCDVPAADVVTVEEQFDLARRVAGAIQGEIRFDDEYGFIREIYAQDRSVELSIFVDEFTTIASPIVTADAFADAKALWEASGIESYTALVDVRCFCGFSGPFAITVVDGELTESSPPPPEFDDDITIDGLFDSIERLLDGDHAELAFHPDLGYPVAARLDPVENGADDEIDYFVLELTPTS